jgi:hypothetical protein
MWRTDIENIPEDVSVLLWVRNVVSYTDPTETRPVHVRRYDDEDGTDYKVMDDADSGYLRESQNGDILAWMPIPPFAGGE